ncbi:hypothetical protein AWRI1631_74340 [Saccharomyces cerevisiae AWRI1631]|uniref:Uncharacterized protein n=1 Tax=Saccharomyces cerevisiae (strain AWRI1631) TaxID=545124 RepID=B5VJF5_YEAS6|nr:hypothetical protein AWRI1631_74340 [Saccharomyces cerevisiae AWRI1631]
MFSTQDQMVSTLSTLVRPGKNWFWLPESSLPFQTQKTLLPSLPELSVKGLF